MANLYFDFGVEPKSTAPYPGQAIPDITDFLETSLLRLQRALKKKRQSYVKKVSFLGTDYSLSVNEDSGLERYTDSIWAGMGLGQIPVDEMPPLTVKGINLQAGGRLPVNADLYSVNKEGFFYSDEQLLELSPPSSRRSNAPMNVSGGVRTIGFKPYDSMYSRGKVLVEFNPLEDLKTIYELRTSTTPQLIRNIIDKGNKVEIHGDRLFNLDTGRGNDYVLALNTKPKFFVPDYDPDGNLEDVLYAENNPCLEHRQNLCLDLADIRFMGSRNYSIFFPNHSTAPFTRRDIGMRPEPRGSHPIWPWLDDNDRIIGINKINWNYDFDKFSTIDLGGGDDIITSEYLRENRLDQKAIVTLGSGRDRIINGNNLTITDFDVWEDQIKTDQYYLQYKYDNEINALVFSNGLRLQNIETPDLIDWIGGESATPVLSEVSELGDLAVLG